MYEGIFKQELPVFGRTDSVALPIQKTAYTCGPACLSALAKFLGHEIEEINIAQELDTKPKTGTCHDRLLGWAEVHFPLSASGCHSYRGGLGVANIINPYSGIGHYVVLLGQRRDFIRYYCPSRGHVYTAHKDHIEWVNGSRTVHNWSFSIDHHEDLSDKILTGQTRHILYEEAL